jgi:hypothetical protein
VTGGVSSGLPAEDGDVVDSNVKDEMETGCAMAVGGWGCEGGDWEEDVVGQICQRVWGFGRLGMTLAVDIIGNASSIPTHHGCLERQDLE